MANLSYFHTEGVLFSVSSHWVLLAVVETWNNSTSSCYRIIYLFNNAKEVWLYLLFRKQALFIGILCLAHKCFLNAC